jgi:hypothetical protein
VLKSGLGQLGSHGFPVAEDWVELDKYQPYLEERGQSK